MSVIDQIPMSVAVPLRTDQFGAIRVGSSRVLLELVIYAFQSGATPEAIVQSYDTLRLADVYAVISFYLAHTKAIDQYLAEQDAAAEELRKEIESSQRDRGNLREILMARAKALEEQRAAAGQR